MKGALVEDKSTGDTVLACSPSIEASLYCHKLLFFNDQQLAQPQCKVFFHSGGRTKMFLPKVFQEISAKWPHIYSLWEPVPDTSHAFVMEKPDQVAQNVIDSLQELQPFQTVRL
uniref:AB hydrolase-1 domain-containing protein n=1 Tax=Phytophthora ramorum TaxID=164328 RepID=H3H0R9_PHYRM